MKVHIEFDTDNAAFENDPKEVNRVMVAAMSKVDRVWGVYRHWVAECEASGIPGPLPDPLMDEHLLDQNGNFVGFVRVTP